MTSKLKLQPKLYNLSRAKQDLLEQVFSQPPSKPILEVYRERPEPSILRDRVMNDCSIKNVLLNHPPVIMEAVLRSIQRSWDTYTESSITPHEFMRAPYGASYEVVAIEGKGRGMVASRDIKAGQIILEESPVLLLPPGTIDIILLLTLPRKALEAILLLHNAKPNNNRFTLLKDIPVHRLLDLMSGILDTNSFDGTASCGSTGVLLLRGSLFNHSDTPNMFHDWNGDDEIYVFTAQRDIKKDEELVFNYVSPNLDPAAKAERLKNYRL